MKKTACAIVALLWVSLAYGQGVTVQLNVKPFPSAVISDLAYDPTFVQVTVTSTSAISVAAYFDISLSSTLNGTLATGKSRTITVTPGVQVLNGVDLISWNDITYNQNVRSQIAQSGMIPEGVYSLCVTLLEADNGQALAGQACAQFTITLPEPPSLLLPADGDVVTEATPTFQWTPVVQLGHQVSYELKIVEVLSGQSSSDALQAGYPLFDNNALTQNSMLYPVDGLQFSAGKTYAWQVRAINELGTPVGQNNGQSEIWTFTFQPGGIVAQSLSGNFSIGGFQVHPEAVTDSSIQDLSGSGWVDVPFLRDSVFVSYSHLALDSQRRVTQGRITVADVRPVSVGKLVFRLDTLRLDSKGGTGWGAVSLSLPPADTIAFAFSSLGFDTSGLTGTLHSTRGIPVHVAHLDEVVDTASVTLEKNSVTEGYLEGTLRLPFSPPNDSVHFTGSFSEKGLTMLDVRPGFSTKLPGLPMTLDVDSLTVYPDSAFLSGFVKAKLQSDSVKLAFARLMIAREGITGMLTSGSGDIAIGYGGVKGTVDTLNLSFTRGKLDSSSVSGIVALPFPSPNDTVRFSASYGDGNLQEILIASHITFPLGPVRVSIDTVHLVRPDTATVSGSALVVLNSEVLDGDSLLFLFPDLSITSKSFSGTVSLGKDATLNLLNPNGFTLKFKKNLSTLTLGTKEDSISLAGSVLPPASSLKDSAGNRVEVSFNHLSVDKDGSFYINVASLPQCQIANTGFHISADTLVLDFSTQTSPPAFDAAWKGLYIKRGTVTLPDNFSKKDGSVSISMAGLSVGTTGLSGAIAASGLGSLGPVTFNKFTAALDSLMVHFKHNSVDSGYISGKVTVPFLDGTFAFDVLATDHGLGEASLVYSGDMQVFNLSYFKMNLISAGITYADNVGKVKLSGKLSIENGGTSIKDISFTDFSVDSKGNVGEGGKVWFNLTGNQGSAFEGFPIQLDSLGFGADPQNPDRKFIGVGARIDFSDNLPSGATTFLFWVRKTSSGVGYALDNVEIKNVDINYQSAAFSFNGQLQWNGDSAKKEFDADLSLKIKSGLAVASKLIVGRTLGPTGFRYWYIDGKVGFGGAPIFSLLPATGIPLSFYGFGGGAFYHMKAVADTVHKNVVYTPDSTVALGLKAVVTLGTDAEGLAWNGDQTLEFVFSHSGNSYTLTNINLYSDNWFLAPLPERTNPLCKITGNGVLQISVNSFSITGQFTFKADIPTLVRGQGQANILFSPNNWYVHIGTKTAPVNMTIYPLPPVPVVAPVHSYFDIDGKGVACGFGFYFDESGSAGPFYGDIHVNFAVEASLAYRPFRIQGTGTFDGEVKAGVKVGGTKYDIFDANLLVNVNVATPNPTRIWGEIVAHYSVAGGLAKGTYRMRYSVPKGSSNSSDAFADFPLIMNINPPDGSTGASLGAVTAELGIKEGEEYQDDNTYWKLVIDSVEIGTRQLVRVPVGGGLVKGGKIMHTSTWVYPNLPGTFFSYAPDQLSLSCTPAGYGLLSPNTTYRAKVNARLLKKAGSNGSWATFKDTAATTMFTTGGPPDFYYDFVQSTYPSSGEKFFHYGGPNQGSVMMTMNVSPPALASGQVVGELVDLSDGSVIPGGTMKLSPIEFKFTPAAQTLQPNSAYLFRLVDTGRDTSDPLRVKYSMSFQTGQYASLSDYAAQATRSVNIDSTPGGLITKIVFAVAGPEKFDWDNLSNFSVPEIHESLSYVTSTRVPIMKYASVFFSPGGADEGLSLGSVVNTIEASAPLAERLSGLSGSTSMKRGLTLRMVHRYEGALTIQFSLP